MQARLALEQFVANAGETKDFRINYAFSFNYYDQSPQSSANPVLQFNITSSFDEKTLGLDSYIGRIFSYKLTLKNLKPFYRPPVVALNAT